MTASREEILAFACAGEQLLSVLHLPPQGAAVGATGVLVVVGGPQYRAGSHRQFVQLARTLAAAGHPVLRFDVRGMGDSSGALTDFEHVTPDIEAALDAFAARLPGLRRFALWGLCDGASAALMYQEERQDRRVAGLCLANPWVRAADSHARTTLRHYYARRVLQPDFWRKLFRGEVGGQSLRDFGGAVRDASASSAATPARSFQERMLLGLERFEGRVLLLLSGEDLTCREFVGRAESDPRWRSAVGRATVTRTDLPEADHTFSAPASRAAAESATLGWLQSWQVPA